MAKDGSFTGRASVTATKLAESLLKARARSADENQSATHTGGALRRALVLTFGLIVGFFIFSSPAQAADFDPWRMTFPVDGEYTLLDNFGDCRSGCSRSHEGSDIMADKGTPVLAVADGVVTWITPVNEDSDYPSVYIGIDHGNGWLTRYIHLNNDSQNADGTYSDDGKVRGIAEGIEMNSNVTAGQLIGWVGDSGNAESTAPHLHFELRKDGVAVDPYDYLVAASMSYDGQFYDDDDSVHEADIDKIYAAGITKGCNPPDNNRYCPDDPVSRGAMAAFIRRWFSFPASSNDYFSDDNGNIFEGDINAIMDAGIGFGCGPDAFCPDEPLLREEFAEMFTRAFDYTNPSGEDWFTDDDDSDYQDSINALRSADVTKGCNPPDNDRFCPYLAVDRAAMASFFVRALDL